MQIWLTNINNNNNNRYRCLQNEWYEIDFFVYVNNVSIYSLYFFPGLQAFIYLNIYMMIYNNVVSKV